ncbi:MAG: PAS domain-containing protein [Eubacteriales bacterium]|nr:PAS domain-containing protein [Eubacteriales bacterium]
MPDMKDYMKEPMDRERLALVLSIKEKYANGEISLAEGRAVLKEKIGRLRPEEIALAEQELKEFEDEECRKEDIQKMLEIFSEVMDTSRPELPEDHPIAHYIQENDALREIFSEIRDLVQYPVIKNQWYELYDRLQEVRTHYSRKQNQLYPVLQNKGFDRPNTTMWTLDDFVRDEVKRVRTLLDTDEDAFIEAQEGLIADLQDLMEKEEHVLYPTSLALISPDEFEEMKHGDAEIGYAWITVEKPTTTAPKAAAENTNDLLRDLAAVLGKHGMGSVAGEEKLDVATGKLTLEQINLIYKHLPVDLSYVDENDLVCFYSDTKHRVFPRSKNVIGRDVKNCHPRNSVHIVEEIVEKFRSGEQDESEFWINKPGLFIYIKYVAVRDEAGRFRGILEMMQDCTHIRAMEGSRTLLTWADEEIGTTEDTVAAEKAVPTVTDDDVAPVNEQPEDEPTGEAMTDDRIDPDSITPQTRLKHLLASYPFLKDELPKINPAFKMLKTPLARIMIPKATVAMMSERSGMPVDELIAALRERIRAKS